MSTKIYRASAFEGSVIVCLARVIGLDGEAVTIVDVATIQRTVWDQGTSKTDTPSTADWDESVFVAATIYDSLQTGDDSWDVDSTGYNFRDVVPGSSFPDGGHRYVIKYVITLATGERIAVAFQNDTEELLGS